MINQKYLILAVLVSYSSFGAVSLQEKKHRVEELMKLQSSSPALSFEAYNREIEYEARGLSLEARTKNETNLLAEKVRSQVLEAYRVALLEFESPEVAREEVRQRIRKDLELASPEMREDLLTLANRTLDQADLGGENSEVELKSVEAVVEEGVVSRRDFLNAEGDLQSRVPRPVNDSNRKDYKNKADLMESLTSSRRHTRVATSATQSVKSSHNSKFEGRISLQVQVEFLGVTLEAGPTITFRRTMVTNATVVSEGLRTVILPGGKIDRYMRDPQNKVILKNGKPVDRYIAFNCDTELKFEAEYKGNGGFKYMGIGGGVTYTKTYASAVSLQSRKVAIPESVQNRVVDLNYLSELCHESFLSTKIEGALTVRQTLNLMMKNVVSGLVFTNPQTKCITDSYCADWFEKDVLAVEKQNNTYRCVEHKTDKNRFCQLRGKEGQSCLVFEAHKLTSSGKNEFNCDWGLKCSKTKNATYGAFNYVVSPAKGICQK